MGDVHPDTRPRTPQRTLSLALVAVMALCIPLLLAGPAGAGPLTGGFSPTIVGQGADVNGNGIVNTADDANAFYGDTSIIDGKLDCDAWGVVANDGEVGNGAITNDGRLLAHRLRRNAGRGHHRGPERFVPGWRRAASRGLQRGRSQQPRHRRFRLRLVGNRRPRGLERQRSHRQRRLPCRGRRTGDRRSLSNVTTHRQPNPSCGFASSPNTSDDGLLDFE